jgi:hypothetical protein
MPDPVFSLSFIKTRPMRYVSLFILYIVLGCSKPTTQSDVTETSMDTTAAERPTSVNQSVHHDHPGPPEGIFVGLAKPLKETREFYVAVYHVDNHTELNTNEFDSVVFEDQGYVRKTIPIETARKYFYLNGMDRLRVYNDIHGYLYSFPLKRIEMISTEISNEYGAVYDAPPSMMNEDGSFYTVTEGAERHFVEDFATQRPDDQRLAKDIIRKLELDSSRMWVVNHCVSMPTGIMLSTLSAEGESLLVQSDTDVPVILSTMDDGYQFGEILQLPLMFNDKPLLIVHYFLPESDDFGDYVMKFTGERYEGVPYSRIKLQNSNDQNE